jgi:hypothetical protein
MRIDATRESLALLYSLREAAMSLRAAIDELRTNLRPADAIDVSGRPELLQRHVRIGDRGFWLMWGVRQDRGETVVRVAIIEEN